MKLRNHLTPEQNIIRLVYLKTLSVSSAVGDFATWVLTGTAAILGAIVVKVETISKVLSAQSLKWGLALLVVSLLAGVITKHLSIALSAALSLSEEMYEELTTPEGIKTIQSMTSSLNELNFEMISVFTLPLRWIMKNSFEHGCVDQLASEKRLVRFFNIQFYAFLTQALFGALGLLILVIGIN